MFISIKVRRPGGGKVRRGRRKERRGRGNQDLRRISIDKE